MKHATVGQPKVKKYVIGDHVFPRGQFRWCTGARIYSWPDTLFIDVPPTGDNFVCETKWLRRICHRSFMTHHAEPVRRSSRRAAALPRRGAIATFYEFVVIHLRVGIASSQYTDYRSWSCWGDMERNQEIQRLWMLLWNCFRYDPYMLQWFRNWIGSVQDSISFIYFC